MTGRYIWIVAFVVFSVGTALSSAADNGAEKRYSLPQRGFLQLNVPVTWKGDLQEPQPDVPPTIFFHSSEGQPFEIYVTPMWRPRPDMPEPTKDAIRQEVSQAAQGAQAQSVEKHIALVEFSGSSGSGFYFSATDPAPKPGEYRFMTQGMAKVNDLLVTFMILTNDGQEQVKRDALKMIKSAVHIQP